MVILNEITSAGINKYTKKKNVINRKGKCLCNYNKIGLRYFKKNSAL